jgi:Zn-dependent protease
VHADTLKGLAAEAEAGERAADNGRALAAWRQALALLPAGSSQYARVQDKVQALSKLVSSSPFSGGGSVAQLAAAFPRAPAATTPAAPRSGWKKWAAGAGVLGVLLLKFKWVLLFVLTKGKVLLLGLTKAPTFLSMAVTIGVYTSMFGWKFAVGLVVSIYIHEMGHVVWLRRYGIPATAPMFIPGLGAFVRLKAHPATVGEDARIGLAGPVWGAGAAILAVALGVATGKPIFFAIARVGAWINMFNLVPIWQLDGGRGFAALSRKQRALVAGALWLLALAMVHHDGIIYFVVAIAATFRAATVGNAPEKGDRAVLVTYLALAAGLAVIMAGVGRI